MIPGSIQDAFQRPFPDNGQSTFRRFFRGVQIDLDNRDESLDYVKASHQIDNAAGQDLDLIGAQFGKLGKRQERGDGLYRNHLKSIVAAFGASGTEDDVKFAIATGVVADTSDISLQEYVSALEYDISIAEWQPHSTNLIENLSDYAEPSGVERRGPIKYSLDDTVVNVRGDQVERGTSFTAPPAQISVSASDVTGTIVNDDGFGADNLGGGDVLGPGDVQFDGTLVISTGTLTVDSGTSQTVDSPLKISGEVSIGGELIVDDSN